MRLRPELVRGVGQHRRALASRRGLEGLGLNGLTSCLGVSAAHHLARRAGGRTSDQTIRLNLSWMSLRVEPVSWPTGV